MIQGLGTRDLIALLSDVGATLSSESLPEEILQALVTACARDACSFAAAYLNVDGPPAAVAARPGVATEELARLALAALDPSAHGFAALHREPLRMKGRQIGTLVLGLTDQLEATAQAAVRTAAMLAAASIDIAQSNANQRRIADRLQRAMLPLSLPSRESVTFFSAYQPATDETLVGGDWYDVFELGDGSLGFSIGDVTGHGLDAAVVMIEARLAIRSAAAAMESPAAVLEFVNHLLSLDSPAGTATAVVGAYDPQTCALRYACAGHPPPLYAGSDRRVIALAGGGLPLGINDTVGAADWRVTLDPGASLVLFTDGLLEYGRDILAGERRVTDALGLERVMAAENPAAELFETVLSDTRNRDDVAVLVIRCDRAPAERLELQYSAAPRFAAIARSAISSYMRSLRYDAATIGEVLSASGEAIANAIEHGSYSEASPGFEVGIERVRGGLQLTVQSSGHWKRSGGRDDRGFGIRIMRAIASDLSFASTSRTTVARLAFDCENSSG